MKRIIFAAAVMLAAAGAAFCAGSEGKAAVPAKPTAAALKTGPGTEKDQVDAIDREMLDIEAMQWAWRVADVKDTSYEKLEKLSERWIIKPDTRKELFKKIKLLLDGKKARPLTSQEKAKFDESKERIRGILAPGMKDKELIKTLTEDYCLNLEARYWAGRVQAGQKEILEFREHWGLKADYKKKLFSKMDEAMKHENTPLTKEEAYKMDGCTAKFK